MSAQLQKGKYRMEDVQKATILEGKQLLQTREVTTELGAAGIDEVDVEEFTELGISSTRSTGALSWMKEDTNGSNKWRSSPNW